MNRLCPKCGQRYRADVAICPVHRVPLVDDPFIGRTLGQYAITGFLGQGAMGVVYRAEPPSAVKILNVVRARMQPELVRRFELEAKAIARLESAHIVRLYDAGTTGDGHLYITMELLRGQTLDELLRHRRRLSPERAADVIHQAAGALSEAHQKWVVHRDIKPDNLFIEPAEGGRPFVRVLDFGVVRINSDSVARSITGTVAGTPAFMSPEQLKSETDIDGRTDVYSLGVVLYQLLAGRNPFQGDGLMQTIQRHLYEPVPPLPDDVPGPLADLTMDMLVKARDERIQAMDDVRRRLVEMGMAQDEPVRMAGPVGVDEDPVARDRTLAALETDPAFQRARQITPVARPMDPPETDESLDLPPYAPPPDGGSFIERGPGAPPLDGEPERDPWRASAPPTDRPSIDAPPSKRPPSTQPRGFSAVEIAALDETIDSAPDLADVQGIGSGLDRTGRTWAGPASIDLAGPETFQSPVVPGRKRAVVTVLIFALGAASGVWFAGRGADDAARSAPILPPVVQSTPDHKHRERARDAMEREDWAEALDAAGRLVDARPHDERARALRAQIVSEAAAAETWSELLDQIADEQWGAAAARSENFPAGSVYRARVDALRGLIEHERAEALLERGFTRALHGDWSGVRDVHDRLTALDRPPHRLSLLAQALDRKRFNATPYTTHLLEARSRMDGGDYRLAITRLMQAAEDMQDEDRVLHRRLFVCHRALGEARPALEHARRWRSLERDSRYGPVIAHAIARLETRVGR